MPSEEFSDDIYNYSNGQSAGNSGFGQQRDDMAAGSNFLIIENHERNRAFIQPYSDEGLKMGTFDLTSEDQSSNGQV